MFQENVCKLRQGLDDVDSDCTNGHYACRITGRELAGHPLPCTIAGCQSKLRTLRAASPHYPMLRLFLILLYQTLRNHKFISSIDSALRSGSFESLALLCGYSRYQKLFSGTEKVHDKLLEIQQPSLPDLESKLHVQHAEMIAELEAKLADDPEYPCCSCERLHQKKNVTAFEFFEPQRFTSNMWLTLKAYMYMSDPDVISKTHYVCRYCRFSLNKDSMPSRCVLNGLEVEPVPIELQSTGNVKKQYFPITRCMILTRRMNARSTSIRSSFCLFHFAMNQTSLWREMMQRVLSIGTWKQTVH